MKHLKIRYTLTLFATVFLLTTGCTIKNTKDINPEFARYISSFTYGNVSSDAFIQVELTQEVSSIELNAEIEDKLFSFSSSVKGQAFWINSNTIRFLPEKGELVPGKQYRVVFHLGKVLKVDKEFKQFEFTISVNEPNFTVDIMPFSPMTLSDPTWNTIEVEINVSNPIGEEEVRSLFNINGLHSPNHIRVVPSGINSFTIFIDSLQRTDKTERYSLMIDGKAIGAKKKINHTIEIPPFSTDYIKVIDAQVIQKTESHIRITFSDPISQSQDLKGMIVPYGVNNFTYRIDRNIIKIYPESLPTGQIDLQIYKGINSISGLKLDKTYHYQLQVEDDKPQVKFIKNGNILPDTEELMIPFSAVNLWAIDVKVIKIYNNNILYYLQYGSLNNNHSSGELRRFGRLVMKKRIRLDSDKTMDLTRWNNFNIDLSEMLEKDSGALYMVQISIKQDYSLYACDGVAPEIPDNENMTHFSDELLTVEDESVWDETMPYYFEPINWSVYNWEERNNPCKPSYYMNPELTVQTMVMASNVGIIAKAGQDKSVSIAVTDIMTTKPISGADVIVYNYQMQKIASGKTNSQGFVDITYTNGRPFVITASKGDDIGYLEVKDETSLSLSRFNVSGKEIQKGLKGYVYAERGVWRPGDTIFISFILEDREKRLPEGHPVTLEVYTPKGQFYQRQIKTEGQNGFYTFSIATDQSVETGMWQGQVKVGGTSFSKSLRIETIKPNRLRVRLDTDSIVKASDAVISGRLTSQWLHGAPASNLKTEVDLTLYSSDNPFNKFQGYTFNNPIVSFETSKTKIFEGVLDASGSTVINGKIPFAENAPGMLKGSILSRVYEGGGDMSFYGQTIYYSPYKTYIGLKLPSLTTNEFYDTDTPINFDVVAVNSYGISVETEVEYLIYKLKWSWWWDSSGEDLGAYVNNTAANVVAKGDLPLVNGKGQINFQVNYPDWGRYLILAKDKTGRHATGTVFYVDWPSWRGRSAKTDPDGLTMLSFSTDKSKYEVGENATVIIPKGSNGRALISIENGSGIVHREWIETSDKEDTKHTIPITSEMIPNFYVFVTMLQPHSQTVNDLPIRMYAVMNVEVEDKNSRLEPQIQMRETIHPEKDFTISITEKSKRDMTYTLSIVDEGLLDLTSFKTPNAWNEFYANEALGVRTWDLFDRVLGANSGLMAPLLGVGGDEVLNPSRDDVNRFKPVVKVAGPFVLKKGETKTHTLRLPQYVGSVRVMVVAGGNGAYGSTEKSVTVKSDLMTLSTLPRVMGLNEEVWLPVNIFVENNNIRDIQVSLQTNGILKPVDSDTKRVSFEKSGDKTVFFKLKSDSKIGDEKIVITSLGNGTSFTETIEIAVRNPNIPIVYTKGRFIEPGETITLDINTDVVEPDDWAMLELSRLPSVNFSSNMNYLFEYPHGCTEQITSQAFPILYIEEFITLKEEEKRRMTAKVDEVIRMISSRQLGDGGFMFWYGDNYPSEWATSYAGHFLIEAKNKGYEVSETVLLRWIQFQKKLAHNWLPTTPSRGYYSFPMSDLQQAYRLYTLALSGNAELGAMNRMRELTGLSLQARWRLAAAYALSSGKEVANSLIFNVTDQVEEYSFNNDTYGTKGRDEAMIMETYLLLDNTEKAMQLASSVAQTLSSQYISTQTAAFGLVAMGQLASKLGVGNIDITWQLNGKNMGEVNTPRAIHQLEIEPDTNMHVNITNKGDAKIYSLLSVRTRADFEVENERPYNQLEMTVQYVDINNAPINVKSIQQGTEFTAIVTVKNGVEQPFTDLALTQVFASGWEILNERILENATTISDSGYNYRDIRDDRVLTYFNLNAGESKTFRVRLQAAYRGTFFLPAVSCQAMYNPSEEVRNTGIQVQVVE